MKNRMMMLVMRAITMILGHGDDAADGKDSVDDNGWVEVWLGIDTNTLLQPG